MRRTADLAAAWVADDATVAGSMLIQAVEEAYVGSFARIARALDGREPLPGWLLRRNPSQRIRLRFVFFDAPVSRVACCLRTPADPLGRALPCAYCGYENRTVVLNVRFPVLCSHVLSRIGFGLASPIPIKHLLETMLAVEPSYRKLPAPLAVDRNVAWAGIGTVLGHELGHIFDLDLPETQFDSPLLPKPFRPCVLAELDADRQAMRTLIGSQALLAPTDRMRPVLTFLGAELVARTLHFIESTERGGINFDEAPLLSPGFYPSPRLRWLKQKEVGAAMASLNLMDGDQWNNLRAKFHELEMG